MFQIVVELGRIYLLIKYSLIYISNIIKTIVRLAEFVEIYLQCNPEIIINNLKTKN